MRPITPRKRSLEFEIPSPHGQDILEFWTHETVLGLEVGYDIQPEDAAEDPSELPPDWLEHYIEAYCPTNGVESTVQSTMEWASRLELKPQQFYLQLVPERMFSAGFCMGRAVTGKGGRALLMLEFIPDYRGMLFPVDDECEDIVPHELMHIKDVLDARSPTMYPEAAPEQGGWIDLFRHLWIDGHLEELGLPHVKKKTRVSQITQEANKIGKALSAGELSPLAELWWGKPMTLREGIETGLSLGFPLEKGCPLEHWHSS